MLFSCKSNSDLKEVEFFFSPSFLYPTKFNIDIKNSTIEQYTFQDSYYVKEWIDSTSYREHRKDTLVVHYKKTFKIDKSELINRCEREFNILKKFQRVSHLSPKKIHL